MRFFIALGLGLAAVSGVSGAAITTTTTKTSTKTIVETQTYTNIVEKSSTSYTTTTDVVTKTALKTVTASSTATVTITAPAITVTAPASTITNTETTTITAPASTVTNTESTTITATADPITIISTVTAVPSTTTTTETDSATVIQTTTASVTISASTVTVTSTLSASGSSSTSSNSSSATSASSTSASSGSSTSTSSSSVTSGTTTSSATSSNIKASTMYSQTSTAAVYAAAETALTSSPTSNVAGAAFDRFVIIWMENTDYSLASTDPNMAYFAEQGITLNGMYGVTHPSQPNYVASHGGDNFGMDNDNLNYISANVSTVFDLLDTKGISWGEYQEGMPYSGFEGKTWYNTTNGEDNYVRKHNPGVIYNSASESTQRLSQMKNLSMFYTDLANEQLPQWLFITPNMYNDGHDTSVTYAGNWLRGFLDPLLNNTYFTENTLILVTWDETETYTVPNNVFGFLLGGAVPDALVNTTDANYYNHYSQLSTVEANWDLPTLGRWDVGANVFQFVAEQTGDTLRTWEPTASTAAFDDMYFNSSYAGPFNAVNSSVPYPVPNTAAVYNGRAVLPAIVSTWGGLVNSTFYTTGIEINDGQHAPAGYVDQNTN